MAVSHSPHALSLDDFSVAFVRHAQNAPLEEAQMSLKNFEASKGNARFLETAHSRAMTALVQGHTLDVKLSAAVIAVSAGYVHMSKVIFPFSVVKVVNAIILEMGDDDHAYRGRGWDSHE